MSTMTTVPRSGQTLAGLSRASPGVAKLDSIIFSFTLGRNSITSCRRTSCGLVMGLSIQSNHDI
jgi:hypothetical protein